MAIGSLSNQETLSKQITDILMENGCTVNMPGIKKLAEFVYNIQLGHVDGFEQYVVKQTTAMRQELEDRKLREAAA